MASRKTPKKAPVSPGPSFDESLADIRDYLSKESSTALVDMLVERATWDDALRDELAVRAAAKRVKPGRQLASLTRALDRAIEPGDMVPRRGARAYANRVDGALDAVEGLLKAGHAASAITLTEHAHTALEAALDLVDDSDGDVGDLLARVEALHLRACLAARPDPIALAGRLLARELGSPVDRFHGAVTTYAEVLGPAGIGEYRRLAMERWSQVRALLPGDNDPNRWGSRFRVTSIMRALAQLDGDLEAEAAVLERGLSRAYDFLKVAELYRDRGRPDVALAWAEKGLAAFPVQTDPRLREFLADAYQSAGRPADAMGVIWTQFAERPEVGSYTLLKAHAERGNAWPAWRAKALAAAREAIAVRQRALDAAGGGRADCSTLVRIFLLEGDVDAAWREAQAGRCEEPLWMTLAAEREKEHPADAVPIYQREVETELRRANDDAYARAVHLLAKIRAVMARMGAEPAFQRYLAEVRAAHARKTNFGRRLDAAALARPA